MEKNIQDNINITSSNSLNIMQQIAKIGSWQYKIEENKIVWDDEIYTIFGIDKESDPILNIKDFLNCIHIDDGYKFFQNYTEHLKTKLPYRTVYRIKTPQNEIKYIEERCETIYDEENNPIITNGTFQDITEHQLTLLDLNQHKLHLAEQAKFSAMGEMISMIAHQWKQPLNVLSLNIASLEVMHMSGKYSKKELEYIIKNSSKTIEYMNKTIYDFSEFLKPSDKKDDTSVGVIFNQLDSLIEADIKKYNIDFNIDFNLDILSTIQINISKFTQVMINIIKNSIDEFKRQNIKIPYIKIKVKKIDNSYIITVKDNAGGMDEGLLNTIFEPYISTKGKNGTGLGMYISKLIVEGSFGGKIDVQNDEYGAVFNIKLPLVKNKSN